MPYQPKEFAGRHCGCRYQQDYRPTLGRDGKKESGTLEVVKFYYDGRIRFEQHCYGEAATFVFGVWAEGMDPDGTLHWALPDRRKSYYDEEYLPKKLTRVDEAGSLYFDDGIFPWKLADDFSEDAQLGLPPLEGGPGPDAGPRQTVTRSHFGGEFPIPIDTVGIMGYNYLGTAPGWCFTICRERPQA